MKGFMEVFFKIGLVRKNKFADYWSTRQSMNTPGCRIIFSRDHLRKILLVCVSAFHIADKTMIPARVDP